MAHRYYETADLSQKYKQFRPVPPKALIDRVMEFLREKYTGDLELAVDVGCGTGQNTLFYVDKFKEVLGTDISESQITEASKSNTNSNLRFEVSPAETINVKDGSVQLITALTAVHWFDHPKFFAEGLRALTPGGVMALYGYCNHELRWDRNPARNEAIREAFDELVFGKTLMTYWPEPFKKYILNFCRNIVIPYDDFVREDDYVLERKSSLKDVLHECQTWSVFPIILAKEGEGVVQALLEDTRLRLTNVVKDDLEPGEDAPDKIIFTVRHPYYLMMARKPSS